MAEVWLAHDERLERAVAVKVLDARLTTTGELADALDKEARTIARLHHPNIVAVFDVGEHEGRRYLVMEYVHGSSLREMLKLHGRLPWADVTRIGRQAAAALAHAHREGVVHCDVKPENVLIDHQGVVKVTDFGVAEAVTRTVTADIGREILGTVAYLAPEVLEGQLPRPPADVYALALTLYEAAAGRLPFHGATPAAVAVQRLSTPPPPLRVFAPSAPPELESALARALARDPSQRFPTAAEFAQALNRVPVGPSARLAAPPGRPPASRRYRTERVRPLASPRSGSTPAWRAVALGAVVAGMALLGVGVGIVLHEARQREGPEPLPTLPPLTVTATVAVEGSPTEAPMETPQSTPSPSPSPTPTPTLEPSPTATPSPVPSPSPEPSPTPTPALTPSPTTGP